MTQRDYLHSAALTGTATVIAAGSDDHGQWVELDRTLFHPQGGGQRADGGFLDDIAVVFVADTGTAVRHYLDTETPPAVGDAVVQTVDASRRDLHARLHTGGHLLAAVAEERFPGLQAVAGHHWPGESRVEISGAPDTQGADAVAQLQARADELIAQDLPVAACGDGRERTVAVGDFAAVPCGGTHVVSLSQLAGLRVTGFKRKKGKYRLSYELA